MAVTGTKLAELPLGETKRLFIFKLGVTGTYTTSGDALDLGGNERLDAVWRSGAAGGFELGWDADNQKVLFYYADYDAVADGALIQVANGATHTGANGAICVGIGSS